MFRYHSPEHFSEWFRQYYGPITRLAGTLSGEDLRPVRRRTSPTSPRQFNRPTTAPSPRRAEYLEAVGVRRA